MDMDIKGLITNKIGPLAGWQWFGIVAVGAFALMAYKSKKGGGGTAPAGMVRDPATGEFKSATSKETVDPVTGARTTSSYEASGTGSAFGGGAVGIPVGYPGYPTGGDVYVNLPGDTQNLNPAQPALHYPPKTAPGPGPGQYGGYWWTPLTEADAADFAMKSVPGLNASNSQWQRTRIALANPQIDWGGGDTRSLIGVPMYIPPGTIGGAGTAHNEPPFPLPPGASLNAPAGYNPPVQQTTVSQHG